MPTCQVITAIVTILRLEDLKSEVMRAENNINVFRRFLKQLTAMRVD